MIARLTGLLDAKTLGEAVLDVGGVGYRVFCSSRTLARLPAVGESVRLEIETWVRAESIRLYGFIDATERDWFRLLTVVQGVGAKAALAILSALEPEALFQAIAAQDKTPLARAVGVGPRLAARVVAELKPKLPSAVAASASLAALNTREAVASALLNLGWPRDEAVAVADRVLARTPEAGRGDLPALLRACLGEMVS